ncbi:MAG: hypothetical protein ACOX9C_12635 [Kiritimatiellia bacterium]|jgi:hypothetical protein
MNFPLVLTALAYSGIVQEVRLLIPLVVLAAACLVLEAVLVYLDIAFTKCWWFFFATVLLIFADLIWSSWTVSTPMADIIHYGENAPQLIATIAAYLFIVGILLVWTIAAGIRQVVIETGGSGWFWGLVRLIPLVIWICLAVGVVTRGNAAVGGDGGLLGLIGL